MKQIICLVLLLLYTSTSYANEVDNAMEKLSNKIVTSYRKLPDSKRQKYVAIMDFQNRSMLAVRNNLGVAFSEILAQHLLRFRSELRVIERKQIESIIREKELKMTGIAEGGNASDYGEILGADLIILGSVFDAGGSVRVNVRMVDAGRSEVLLNESINIDSGAFVKKAKRFVKVTHTVSAGYMYQTIDDYTIHDFYIMYSYDFFYGLTLNFQVLYGFSDEASKEFTYKEDMDTYMFIFEKKFQQTGFSILFSKNLDLFWGFGLTPYAGPMMLYYVEKSKLKHLQKGTMSPTVYNPEPVDIFSSQTLFGYKAGITLDYKITMNYKIFAGYEYQYMPEYQTHNSTYWQDTPAAQQGTISWQDSIKLTGHSITAGAAYSF